MATTFETERDGRVLTVRFDNPPRNFMTRTMVGELTELVGSLEGDASVGSVILTGRPEGLFITHYDVAEILSGAEEVGMSVSAGLANASLRAVSGAKRLPGAEAALARTPASGLLELHAIHDLFLSMGRMDKVFIAAINGAALAGACELALACDLRYMAEGAEGIGLPEVTLGFCPGAGGTQRLARVLGPSRALEMILEGRALSPIEAQELGLVHRVVPDADLLAEARRAAERLARRAPLSVAATKHAVLEGASRALPEGLAVERKWFMSAVSQPAAQRAMREYVEQLEHQGVPPFTDSQAFSEWREGTAVDLISEG